MYRRANPSMRTPPIFSEPLERRVLLSGLAVTYATSTSDPSGLATLSYNGVPLINNSIANKGYQVNRYYTLNGDGSYSAVYGGTGFTPNWNTTTDTLTYTYYWGTITCQYVQVGTNRLNMIFAVNNSASSGITLGGVDIYPAAFYFPNALVPSNETQIVNNPSPPAPAWYSIITYGSDGPAVEPADYSGGSNPGDVMAMVNDSPASKSMYTALWTYNDVNTNHDYYMFVGTGPKDSMLPPPLYSTTPLLYQNTAPGSSDNFEISLRFGAKGIDPMTLAPDIESAYATQYPDTVNWPDRRPIASLHITSPPTHALNPEGWLNNVNTDYTSGQTALNNFASALLSDAAGTVTQMQNDNAQGVIVWDLEGQRWPQATTYIGDPSLATSLYPNATDSIEQPVTLNNGTVTTPMGYNYNGNGPLIDQFFAVFRNAGFRTGMTIRPTVITFNGPNGNPQQTSPVSPATEASVIEGKIQYALATWGCTLFYLDSNTGFDRDALAQVEAAYPQVLIIPEHSYTSVYASTAPYGQLLTYDFVGTPADVRLTYPNAFSVIYPADGDGEQSSMPDYYAAMEANIALGDIILFRGWYADPYNTTMVQMYDQAVPSAPATPTGVTATPAGAVINVSWNAITGTGIYGTGVYDVRRATSSNGTYTVVGYNINGTSYSDVSAVKGTQYYYEVAAINGRSIGSYSSPSSSATTSSNAPPTAFFGAHAVNFNGSSANLSVLGADTAAESTLTYTWACTTTPPNLSQPTYSVNGTNAAKYATVAFYQLGTYAFTGTIKDGNNATTTSNVTVVVNQFTEALAISPLNAIVAGGTTTTYSTPTGTDQFGGTITAPFATWSASGAANAAINYSTGIFTSNQSAGSYTIYANFGTVQSSTGVTVVPDVYSGSSGNDSYTLGINASNTSQDQLVVSISGSGTVTYYIPTVNLPSLTINSSSGNDTLTISFANGNPLPANGVTFSGGAGSNAIYVQGVATGGLSFALNSASFTDTASPSSPISYTNVGKLEFDLSGGANFLTQKANPVPVLTYNAGSGSNTLNVSGGTYTFSTDPQIADGNLTLNDNTSVIFSAANASSGINARQLAALNLGPGATAIAQTTSPATDHADRLVLVLNAISINATGQLDLGGNDLLLHSSAANRAADMTRVNGYITTGFKGGLWNGSGIESSLANSSSGRLTSLGLILNDDGSNPGGVGNPLITPFDGQTAVATDLLIKYTYFGDATLDGKVDGSDYTRIDAAMLNPSLTGWHNGDFNYDGVINGSDYTLIDNAFNSQGAKLTSIIAESPSAIPAAMLVQGPTSAQSAPTFGTSSLTIDDLLDGLNDHRRKSAD